MGHPVIVHCTGLLHLSNNFGSSFRDICQQVNNTYMPQTAMSKMLGCYRRLKSHFSQLLHNNKIVLLSLSPIPHNKTFIYSKILSLPLLNSYRSLVISRTVPKLPKGNEFWIYPKIYRSRNGDRIPIS